MTGKAPLAVGQTMTTPPRRLTREALIAFAKEFDPQPMHVDEEAAKASFFGELTASGWHALSLTMRLVADAKPMGDTPMIGAELTGVRFYRPVLADTDLMARISLDSVEQGRGQHSYNLLTVETLDAGTGEILIRQGWRMLRL